MTITLLSRLEALADSASSDTERAIFRAQWAAAIARLGRVDTARAEIVRLRATNTAYSPRLTAWIWMAEGLADHFESLSVNALDRFKRAYGVASALQDIELTCLASAWIGASEFLTGQYESATKHALEAITRTPTAGSLALSRAHLVLANVFSAVGAIPDATAQYSHARRFAVDAHDISMQSAVLYNVAAFRIARISLLDAIGESVNDEIDIAHLELNSIANLDTGIGVDSLTAMVPILRAQLTLIKKEWALADSHYSASLPKAATYGPLRWEPRFLAEQSQCKAMMGMRDLARELAAKAVSQATERIDLDDLAACHARLALTFAALSDHAEAAAQTAQAACYFDRFIARQKSQRERIASLVPL